MRWHKNIQASVRRHDGPETTACKRITEPKKTYKTEVCGQRLTTVKKTRQAADTLMISDSKLALKASP
jgi:hypothetical protein